MSNRPGDLQTKTDRGVGGLIMKLYGVLMYLLEVIYVLFYIPRSHVILVRFHICHTQLSLRYDGENKFHILNPADQT